ncbi:23S ribosomal RNA methyltransferase Erm [Oerskovia sp. NPDC056781]|uniref:23S ribosomal RNA methyltransferase Erm n=1 Tax=Oerskovia sp. NPDC056781 TaxID=3345942 RepID=UPI003670F01B
MPHLPSDGRHEHGQNFLTDPRVPAAMVDLVARTSGPILEIGPGDGAITVPLARLGRPVVAVEIDGRHVARLRRRLAGRTGPSARVDVRHADYLHFPHPAEPHVVVGNVPFHVTTPILRKLLDEPGWSDAVLLVQWEVARRRAGVGGATLLTAQWWPWFSFELHGRVPARAFRPSPGTDGGLLRVTRRALLPAGDRAAYQRFVADVFTGRGRGLADVLRRRGLLDDDAASLLARERLGSALARDLTAPQWVALWGGVRPGAAPRRTARARTGGQRRSRH